MDLHRKVCKIQKRIFTKHCLLFNYATNLLFISPVTNSLIFLIVPTIMNCIVAILLMIRENLHNHRFHDWFKSNVTVASIFTILGATNIEALIILSSKFAGLSIFSAEYSEKTERLLFWYGLLSFTIEDIPQFIIQVVHRYISNVWLKKKKVL